MSLAGLPLAPIGGPLRAWLDSAVASEKLSPTSKVDVEMLVQIHRHPRLRRPARARPARGARFIAAPSRSIADRDQDTVTSGDDEART